MVQEAFIQDDQSRLVVLSDQAHGVSSQNNGQMEVGHPKDTWGGFPVVRILQIPLSHFHSTGHAAPPPCSQKGSDERVQPDIGRLLHSQPRVLASVGSPSAHHCPAPQEQAGSAAQACGAAEGPAW